MGMLFLVPSITKIKDQTDG